MKAEHQATQQRLYATDNAMVWAEEFCRIIREYDTADPTDEGFMVGWFANAIETAKDIQLQRLAAMLDAEEATLAQRFHEAYERLAPDFGYRTREASAVPWGDVPEANKRLMVAVAAEVIDHQRTALGVAPTARRAAEE